MLQATARALANIAFIKYWGNSDHDLRLPVNPSLSMNLHGLYTETTVLWDDSLLEDMLVLNGKIENGAALERVSIHLNHIRQRCNLTAKANVVSANNFPMGAGIASSASAFAALTLAAVRAAQVKISERELTILARLGSGSAARSIPSGFVEWHVADNHRDSFAESFAAPNHWDIMDVIAIISERHKQTGSTAGHRSAETSILQQARVHNCQERYTICRRAILDRDFTSFAAVVEHDSNLMHAVMMTSHPPLFYWEPATLTIMKHVRQWREQEGLQVCYTLDAGANVHCICVRNDADTVKERLLTLSDVSDVRIAKPGGAARLITPDN